MTANSSRLSMLNRSKIHSSSALTNRSIQSIQPFNRKKYSFTRFNKNRLILCLLIGLILLIITIVVSVYFTAFYGKTTTTIISTITMTLTMNNISTQTDTTTTTPSTTTTTTTTTSSSTTSTTTTSVTEVTKYIGPSYNSICNDSCVNVSTSTMSTFVTSWSFENNLYDQRNMTNGYVNSGASGTYEFGYINNCLSTENNQYMMTNTYIPFDDRSFTVDGWLKLTKQLDPTIDYGIFGQCAAPTTRMCLHLAIRFNRFYFGFYGDDITGLSPIPMNVWFHVAFVYEVTGKQRSIYINGILDISSSTGLPYKGTSGNIYIGNVMFTIVATPFPGLIDQIKITNRTKSPCEILNDATLVSYYSFDLTIDDQGPNDLQSSIGEQLNNGISFQTGIRNQALLFSKEYSYFQSWNYHSLTIDNQSYSYSLWIYPNLIKGTILHLSSDKTGSGRFSLPILSFSINGSLVAQTFNGSIVSLYGPQIPISNWTHIALTWSSFNGLKLYINGDLYSQLAISTYQSLNVDRLFILLGTSGLCNQCQTSQLLIGSYFGSIDEFYVYNRELTSNDICVLSR